MIHAVTLGDFAWRYVETRELSTAYRKRILSRAAACEAHAGETAISRVLVEPTVNEWLASLAHLSPRTVRSYREDILTLWLAAADEELAKMPFVRRIRRQKCPPLHVECYGLDEGRQLVACAEKLAGAYRWGVKRAAYWVAMIRAAWDSGLRRGDLLLLKRDAIRPDGTAWVVQHKTGQGVWVAFRPETVDALPPGPKPLAWGMDVSFFARHFRRIVLQSAVGRGSFKWLRRASGSFVEAEHPGAGHKHLGNGAQVFARHYDARLSSPAPLLPPRIEP